jgi:acetyl esterase/lipase
VVQVAGQDPLRDEGIAYAERLRDEGVAVDLYTYQGLPHCFYMFASHPQSVKYYDNVLAFVENLANTPCIKSKV